MDEETSTQILQSIIKKFWGCLKGTEANISLNTLMSFDMKEGKLEELKTTQTIIKHNPNLDKIVKTRSNPYSVIILYIISVNI